MSTDPKFINSKYSLNRCFGALGNSLFKGEKWLDYRETVWFWMISTVYPPPLMGFPTSWMIGWVEQDFCATNGTFTNLVGGNWLPFGWFLCHFPIHTGIGLLSHHPLIDELHHFSEGLKPTFTNNNEPKRQTVFVDDHVDWLTVSSPLALETWRHHGDEEALHGGYPCENGGLPCRWLDIFTVLWLK